VNKLFIFLALFAYFLVKTFTDFTVYESLSVALFVYLLFSFMDQLGKRLVVLDLIMIVTFITCLLMPIAGYHYFTSNNYLSKSWWMFMRVPTDEYYSYMLPAAIALWLGLKLPVFFRSYTLKNHANYMRNAKNYLKNSRWQGVIMVAIGLFASFTERFMPGGLSTLFFFMKYLMFVGLFYCLYSDFPNKRIILVIVFAISIFRSIMGGMFGELLYLSMLTFILALLGNHWKFITKISLMVAGVFLILLIQSIKPAYRSMTWGGKYQDDKLSVFSDLVGERLADPSRLLSNEKQLFGYYGRFNQGQIISQVLFSVPYKYPYANGETILLSLAGSVVPRFLWPDKPEGGGVYNFERFLGLKLKGYSIGLSPFGEAWGNFGKNGGIVFMFFFGLMFNFFFHLLLRMSISTPSLILWFPFLFFYAVQIESDVITMLNSFIKAGFFAFLCYKMFPLVLKLKI
jgi:hypothetical protein